MSTRIESPLDRLIGHADGLLRTLAPGAAVAARPNPAEALPEGAGMDAEARRHAARLMRVNHSGEVAAQALYQGQAMTARLDGVRDAMRHAAAEETDHLAWCESRVHELGERTSLLNPLWYAGSFAIGALAGIAGDRWSLGFVAETERQVCRHLDQHLERLPADDLRSRAIVHRMRLDEAAHGAEAEAAGGADLPAPMQRLMTAVSRLMTRTAYWV